MPVKSKMSVGAEKQTMYHHFCPVVGCSIVGHQLSAKKVTEVEQHEGWLFQVETQTREWSKSWLWFPLHEDGSPITPGTGSCKPIGPHQPIQQ